MSTSSGDSHDLESPGCGVKSIEHLKLLFVLLGSPLAALEREKIFELTKSFE